MKFWSARYSDGLLRYNETKKFLLLSKHMSEEGTREKKNTGGKGENVPSLGFHN